MEYSKTAKLGKYARASLMARRYGVSRVTWWRWATDGKLPRPAALTPSGDKLWNVEECDKHFEGFAKGLAA